MELTSRQSRTGDADGVYRITAPSFSAASLYWSYGVQIAEEWTALAHFPLNEEGNGVYVHGGGQHIPDGITHVAAVLKDADGNTQTVYVPVSVKENIQTIDGVRFCVMSDLHLSAKSGRIHRALRLGQNADCVLLVGDMTNDGSGVQLREFAKWIDEELNGVPVLCVTGNHDYPRWPIPLIPCEEIEDYPSFQRWILRRARTLGVQTEETACGAYRAWVKGVPVIGLNAVSHFRTFVFQRGEQLACLEKWLAESDGRSIVMCHAPLLSHNPVRTKETHPAYLSRDKELQEILDQMGNCIFLSGHTHISANDDAECLQTDDGHGNLYINDSSVTRTMMVRGAASPDAEWLDGAVIHLTVDGAHMSLTGQCISSQKYISRAHYRF